MHQTRRAVLKAGGGLGLVAVLGGALLRSGPTYAARNQRAFDAKSVVEAMRALGVSGAQDSKEIQIRAPDIAENGAVVPIDITSNVQGTTAISVIIEKNPFPYTGTFDFPEGTLPYVHLRVKIGESSPVRVVVAAGGKYYTTAKEVKVTIGGCGG
jgi:sulfur-oxidizing protein SoxY